MLNQLRAHEMIVVVAGVLERDGLVLCCQRREDQPHALKWEFPGGKVEAGEEPAAALVRELNEELGIEAEAGIEITRYEFSYAEKKPILLIFFAVTDWHGDIDNKIFKEIRWLPKRELKGLDFLEGDAPFIAREG